LVTLDRTLTRALAVGTDAVNFAYVDGPSPVDPGSGDERTLVIQVSHGPPGNGWGTQVLYQLDPNRPLTKPLHGSAAMTGTVSLRGASGGDGGVSNATTVGCTIP
jgi:hypothetical protein